MKKMYGQAYKGDSNNHLLIKHTMHLSKHELSLPISKCARAICSMEHKEQVIHL